MDFTGTRRQAQEELLGFFSELADALISKAHPEPRQRRNLNYDEPWKIKSGGPGAYVEDGDAEWQRDVVKSWRLAGYALGTFLLPTKKVGRVARELESFIDGLRQRLYEYEQNHRHGKVEALDLGAVEKLESRAEKLLRLATHESTPREEASAAALGLARLVASSELVVLSWERVRHFVRHLRQMEEVLEMMRQDAPELFYYGSREEKH